MDNTLVIGWAGNFALGLLIAYLLWYIAEPSKRKRVMQLLAIGVLVWVALQQLPQLA